jgi:hypothetical protein
MTGYRFNFVLTHTNTQGRTWTVPYLPKHDVSVEVRSVAAAADRQYFDSYSEVWAASVLSCSLQKSLSQQFMASLSGAVTALNQLWSLDAVQTDRQDKTESQSGPVYVIVFEFDAIAIHSVHCFLNCLTANNRMQTVNV